MEGAFASGTLATAVFSYCGVTHFLDDYHRAKVMAIT